MTVDEAIGAFARSVELDRCGHAHVIVGAPSGSGLEFCDRLLGLLFCVSPRKPCGACSGCVTARRRVHPDLIWIEPQMKSRVVSIDQIREVSRIMSRTSFAGGWKVCVVMAADRLNPQAANAFLKTLEEPRGRALFFLVTESPESLLPTIASRCWKTTLSGAPASRREGAEDKLLDIIGSQSVPDPARAVVRSLSIADRVDKLLKELRRESMRAETGAGPDDSREEAGDTLDARAEARYREARTRLLRTALLWYRDILALSCGAGDAGVFLADRLDATRAQASRLGTAQALRNVRVLETMNRRLEQNVTERTVLCWGFSELCSQAGSELRGPGQAGNGGRGHA